MAEKEIERKVSTNILDLWDMSKDALSEIIVSNPSLRGFLFGYVSEYKLRKWWFSGDNVADVRKHDDHSRKNKGDLVFNYKGVEVKVEAKSLQTNSITTINGTHKGKFQCDASDCREVMLPNGQRVKTTCLVVDEFDLLAVNLFQFENKWQFAFARNQDLPRSTSNKYTPTQRKYLLATLMDMTLPLQPPFEAEPFRLLDEIAKEKKKG